MGSNAIVMDMHVSAVQDLHRERCGIAF